MEIDRPGTWRTPFVVALLFLALSSAYVALIRNLDHTNLGTTNGLWKAPWVNAWETGSGRPADTGDLLYLPVYGVLCRLIPDSAVSYGVPGRTVTYRKMAVLNAFFSALASCVVCLIGLRFTRSIPAALLAVAAHCSAGFVLLHSVNSEDVTPAYTFFLAAAWCLFEYVACRKPGFLALCVLFLTLTGLFHWTLLVPAAAALEAVLLVLVVKRRHPAWLAWGFPLFCLAAMALSAALVHGLYPYLASPFRQVLVPSKAAIDGWSGFSANKVLYALIGMGNYFSGAQHLSSYREAFGPPYLAPMIVSWLVFLIACTVSLWVVFRRGTDGGLRLLAGFGLVLFLVGEVESMYVQPQDPQWQMQPMFLCTSSVILAFALLRQRMKGWKLAAVGGMAAAFFLGNGVWNARHFAESRGADSRSVSQVKALAAVFPPGEFTHVSHIYEPWNTWWYFEYSGGDFERFDREDIHLLMPFTKTAGLGGHEAAAVVRARITQAFASGHRVVACALWTQDWLQFEKTMTALTDSARARVFYDELRASFRLGRTWATPVGPFVELLPDRASVLESPETPRPGVEPH